MEVSMYVDASRKGLGMVIGEKWQRWLLNDASQLIRRSPVTNEPDPNWLELLAVYTALQTAVEGGHAGRILLCSDSMTVVTMLNQVSGVHPSLWGIARNPPRVFVDLLKRIGELCEKHGLMVETQWVPTKENPADDPSRGKGLSEDKRLRYGRVISDDMLGTVISI
jgi:ribonuclease HI